MCKNCSTKSTGLRIPGDKALQIFRSFTAEEHKILQYDGFNKDELNKALNIIASRLSDLNKISGHDLLPINYRNLMLNMVYNAMFCGM